MRLAYRHSAVRRFTGCRCFTCTTPELEADAGMTRRPYRIRQRAVAILLSLLLAIGILSARETIACPAAPQPVEVLQPDGTKLELTFHGDKYYHWYEDTDGYTVVRNGRSYFYAERDGNGDLKPSRHLAGKTAPQSLGVRKGLRPSLGATTARRTRVLPVPVTAQGKPIAIEPAGVVKNLVVLCKFADHTFGTHTRSSADYDYLFNGLATDPVLAPTGTVRMAFDENSYGILDLQSTVAAWVTLPHPESYYTGGSSGLEEEYPTNPQGMVEDALDAVNAIVDFGDFDADNDGYIDAISIVHSGYGAETGGGGGFWMWSHRWSLWALPGGEWSSGDTNALGNSVKVYDYHTEPALWGTSGTDISRIGVIVHETGHFFGLPDYYDINGGGQGIGSYCMMANSWGFDGSQFHPPHFSAYSKMQLGWLTPTSLSTAGNYSIDQAEFTPQAYRIDLNFPSGEYLLIENRQPVGLESVMPQGGLCIWHVDEAKCCNTDQGYPGQPGWPGNNQHYRIALLQADGDYDLEEGNNRGDGGDVYHAGGVDEINSMTSPSTDAYQGGNVFATDHSIYNISTAGATMSFDFSTFVDCNNNGTEDANDISSGTSEDCNGNGIPDDCELGAGDCNNNDIPDICDILTGTATDCDNDGVPDDCETLVSGTLFETDFESGIEPGWDADGIFQVTGSCSAGPCDGGSAWAYAGSTSGCSYGDAQDGSIVAPEVTLGYGASVLSFCTRYDTESDYDFARVFADNTLVWEASGTDTTWHEEFVDVSAFAGQTVEIRFDFFSDAFVSGFLGWQVDNIRLESGAPDCNSNGVPDNCDISSGDSSDDNGDGIPDECTGCTMNAQCDDGIFCNGTEICSNGVCLDGTAPDCDDGVSCTVDSCNEDTDSCDNTASNALCDDGLFCNGAETCDAALDCQAGTAPDCDDGVSCTVDSCNETIDQCQSEADDALCQNGLYCDGTETCNPKNGCEAGTPPCPIELDCDEDKDMCVGCTADEQCNDGSECTDDTCEDMECVFAVNYNDQVFCCDPLTGALQGVNDGDPCTLDVCDAETGMVEHQQGSPYVCAYSQGGRFLQVELLTKPGQPVAVRIATSNATAGDDCMVTYVQADGSLAGTPLFLPSESWGSVLVFGEQIVPETEYDVQVEDASGLLGEPLATTTAKLGDVDGNGTVNFSDIQQTVLVFQVIEPYTPAAEWRPCVPNFIVNFEDILATVQGFQNIMYEETGCPMPCP